MQKKQKVLVIVGPTSSGKSALAVGLAKKFDGEVISADSRQVYRGLNIGTGKITKREMKGVPHHLLDVASPKRKFSADDYVRYARTAIEDISKRGKLPIVAGGTGFYIDALVGRIALPNVPPNTKLRAQLEKKSVKQLFALLRRKDPRRAKNIEPQHKRRIIRALEIAASIGKSPTARSYLAVGNILWIGIAPPMKELEKKIAVRLFARIRQGMAAEAKRLHVGGLSYKRMEELGLEYRSLAHLLQGAITREQMTGELNRAIRKYAIRQMRYWKRNKDIRWFKT
ncbi:MAG TPA: tRNA (adenosine(37)-N6)-dimethylallyltransferase MiaA, partial [Candidatus Paceibacterota bacterium]